LYNNPTSTSSSTPSPAAESNYPWIPSDDFIEQFISEAMVSSTNPLHSNDNNGAVTPLNDFLE